MKILIATGLYPPDVGGPAEYAKNLHDEFVRLGHKVRVVSYTRIERFLPFGVRHFYYFLRLVRHMFGVDFVLSLDLISVGFPSVCATSLFGKKNVIRVGGDFLWEAYVERTGKLIPLSNFYKKNHKLNLKEKLIYRLMKFTLCHSSHLAFNSDWQRNILIPEHGLNREKTSVILNFIGEKLPSEPAVEKNFIWAVRPIKLKNGANLEKAFLEAQKVDPNISLDDRTTSHDELFERLKSCYAVILPSVSEVSPNLIFDAIRFGKPFIVTKETGAYEMLKGIGLFVDPLNLDDIAEKIIMLSDDKMYQMYQSKVESFSMKHSWGEVANEFLNLFKKK
ncbi:MAG: glycosyltransferase [Candidatus Taylorbacteria bacterium]|nr:glycosyltransferase [Candidatus Taylorbacteria bacterium]